MARRAPDISTLKLTLERALEPWKSMLIPESRITYLEHIAKGGYGAVWKAELLDAESATSTTVAVKKLFQTGEDHDRLSLTVGFARELNVWGKVDHPNILPLVGIFLDTDAAIALFISPYEPNGNIHAYLKKNNPDATKRLELAIDTAEGLAYLHGAKPHPICHGDIKSQNVVINGQLRAMLCDFGLAKVVEENPSGLTTTRFDEAGTVRYQSPELINTVGARRTLKSDIWAWGGLALEVLTNELPYSEWKTLQVFSQLNKFTPPASVTGLPISKRLQDMLERCWHKEPNTRPQIQECADDLRLELYPNANPVKVAGPVAVVEVAHPTEVDDLVGVGDTRFCGVCRYQ